MAAVRDTYGGEAIVSYGGGGQGNHLGGVYGSATLAALGSRFKASAISQEKTGEMLVMGKMFGVPLRGDFEHCEVAFFIGKNPWISHGIPHARTTLKAIAADPDRAMIVIDPRVSETAALADFHLRVRPGRDAWLVAAMAAVLVDEGLVDRAWLARRTRSTTRTRWLRSVQVPISQYCEIAGVDEALVRAATRRIAAASSVAAFEDLGVQMNRHSTLVSYLEKLVWLLTGNVANPGGQYAMTGLGGILRMGRNELHPTNFPVSPVLGWQVIGGLIPCNILAEEILTDHPKRYRAMFVESGNPVHSVVDSAADARGDAGPRRQRVHRRVHDRDGQGVRLRAAGDDAVREVRGDVLQLRVPAELLPPAPTGGRATAGPAGGAGDPCPAGRRARDARRGRRR